MEYVILGYRSDGSISELFRTKSVTEAENHFYSTERWSYTRVVLTQELAVRE